MPRRPEHLSSRGPTAVRRLQRGIGWLVVASGSFASIALLLQSRLPA